VPCSFVLTEACQYAEKLYGIKSVHDAPSGGDGDDDDEGAEDDIEAAIEKEVAALNAKPTASSTDSPEETNNRMTPVKMNVDCLLFVKTQPPIDPVAFVHRICEDARRCGEIPGLMRCRYVNRLTPVNVMGKASENGLVEVAREALGVWFDLSGKRAPGAVGDGEKGAEGVDAEGGAKDVKTGETEAPASDAERKPFTVSHSIRHPFLSILDTDIGQFAIRPTIRNHSNLKRDFVINAIAGLINDDRHKVNLTSPDKVIFTR
jgi:tRNA acetyltransferase TAN1